MQEWQFINNFNQLDMFRAIISPILRSSRLCLQQVKVKVKQSRYRSGQAQKVPGS